MNLFKKIDNFILKLKFTDVLLLTFALICLNFYSFIVNKYNIRNLDNIIMCFSLNFSTIFWYKFFNSVIRKNIN